MTRGSLLSTLCAMALLLSATTGPSYAARLIYVDDDAAGLDDSTSWENAYTYLQDALADANDSAKPVEIRVAQGTYKPDQGANQTPGDREASFHLISGVTITGGYAGVGAPDPNARDVAQYETILSGDLAENDGPDFADYMDNTQTIITSTFNNHTAALDGFTITAGHGWSGPAITCYDSSPTIRNCTITKNKAAGREGGWGGAMYNSDSSPTLQACTFEGNWAMAKGGAIWNQGDSNPEITDCTFNNNYAKESGGAIAGYAGSPILTGCTFSHNLAANAGAIYNMQGAPTLTYCAFSGNKATSNGGAIMDIGYQESTRLTGCTFAGNIAQNGGAIWIDEQSSILNNCTFTGNRALQHGGAIYCWDASVMTLTNCILWGNPPAELEKSPPSTMPAIHYSTVKGGWTGQTNIDADPCFADPGHWDPNGTPHDPNDDVWIDGDYHLKSQAGRWEPATESWVTDDVTSPCIDTGDPMSPIGHEPFPNGGIINMGAYGTTAEASKSYFGKPPCETIIAGDINGDCRADFADFALMALHWLWLDSPQTPTQPPSVQILQPHDDDTIGIYQADTPITIRAEAIDSDGSVVKVEFFVAGSAVGVEIGKVGEDTNGSNGWQCDWIWWGVWGHYPEGQYTLTARATDNDDASATSPPVTVRIHGPK